MHLNRLELSKLMTLLLLLSRWYPRSFRDGGTPRGRSSGWCSGSFEILRALLGERWGLGDGLGELSHSFPGLAGKAAVPPGTTRGQQTTSLHTPALHHTSGPTLVPQTRGRAPPQMQGLRLNEVGWGVGGSEGYKMVNLKNRTLSESSPTQKTLWFLFCGMSGIGKSTGLEAKENGEGLLMGLQVSF